MSIYMIIDGIATCLEAWMLVFLLQNEEVKGRKTRQIFLFLALVISVMLMTRLDSNLWLKVIVQIAIIVIVGRIVYSCSTVKLLFYGIIDILAIIVSSEVVIGVWNIYNEAVLSDNIIYEDFTLSLLVATKAFYFFIIMICKKITSKNKGDRTLKEIMPILCIGIPFMLVFECLNILLPKIQEETERVFYLISYAAILFAFIYILVFFENHLRMQKKAKEEELVLNELQLKHDYYERRREDEEEVREIYHDLKNHLLLLKDDDAVKAINHKIESYESYIETGHDFLDIIICEKIKLAQKRHIRMECDINFEEGSFIETLDVSTIFGNLVDNAIEAADKSNESEKYIFVKVQKEVNCMIIVIKNSMMGIYNDNVRTSKPNSSFHGYGLKNVKNALKKYNGELDIKRSDNEFMISIVLPIPVGKLGESEELNGKN